MPNATNAIVSAQYTNAHCMAPPIRLLIAIPIIHATIITPQMIYILFLDLFCAVGSGSFFVLVKRNKEKKDRVRKKIAALA